MKVRDRITGLHVLIQPKVQPSRYEVVGDAVIMNGQIALSRGDVLFSDGSPNCSLNGWSGSFNIKERSPEDQARYDLVSRAVMTIAEVFRQGKVLPSPLLPQDLLSLSNLLPIEELLDETMENGHLHEIARSPRLDMHYQEEVTTVSRARRLAPSAGRHLASNTQCWQQRTLSGVVPKTILAMFSTDDYAIYENRLYVRLLDRLGEHLVKRLAEAETILEQFLEAQNFQKAQDTYFRLREDICAIWGETFDESQTSQQLKITQETVDSLQFMLRGIRTLKQAEIYRNIPKSSQVPDQIHMTNILLHDQHYRHLSPLWKKQQETSAGPLHNPEERFRAACESLSAYTEYVGLLLKRSIDQLTASARKVFGLELVRESMEWHLISRAHSEKLVFIPVTEVSGSILCPIWSKGEIRVPVLLEGDYREFNPLSVLQKDQKEMQFVVTPLDFFVEEKMVTFLNIWCWQPVFCNYGKERQKVPAPVTSFLSTQPGFSVEEHRVVITAPAAENTKINLFQLLSKHANDELQQEFKIGIAEIDLLSSCPGCGVMADFEPRDKKSFKASCPSCGLEWGVFNKKSKRMALLSNSLGESGDFFKFGRWHMELFI